MNRYGRVLSLAEARELRILRVTTHASIAVIAVLYDISETTVLAILSGRSYAEAGGPADETIFSGPWPAAHGTVRCYVAGCRQPECVQANKDRCREYRERKKKEQKEN